MRAVFLDRDNTLIVNEGDLGDPSRIVLQPGVGPALRSLRQRGYRLIVVTNQGGVARGAYTERDVDTVHQRIAEMIDREAGVSGLIDRFYYCPYHPEGTVPEYRREHPWRKPQPGMLIQAARDLDLELADCWMIGDQSRDVAAGVAAGCRTILITRDQSLASEARPSFSSTTIVDAARVVLEQSADANGRRRGRQGNGLPAPERFDEMAVSAAAPQSIGSAAGEFEPLRRAVHDLTEEIRSERLRRSDFTPLRMAAGLCQLSVVLLAMLGLLQMSSMEAFIRWMLGAVVLQLLTITLLLVNDRA